MSDIEQNIIIPEATVKKISPQCAYYHRHRDELLEKQKQYNKDNRSKCNERNKKYYDKEYHRLYYHRKLKPQKEDEVEIINNTE
jgi:hypothetical protein